MSRDDAYQRGICRYALTFPNTGAIATPLVLAFFGTEGLFLFNLFYHIPGWLCYTWGIIQLQPSDGNVSVLSTLKKCINPATLVPILGLILGLLGAKNWIPSVVLNTVGDLGDC